MRFFGRKARDDEHAAVRLKGVPYLEILARLHRDLAPQAYLEVGTSRGDSLLLASCTSIAIDPAFRLDKEVVGTKPALHLLRHPSADVYARGDLAGLLPNGANLIFIDGLHLVEAVLDDVIGCEPHAAPGSTMVLHDVLPINTEMAARDGTPQRRDRTTADWWTGDVWKIIPILARHRPDLRLTLLDSQPTGLLVVQGLDPANRTLAEQRDRILAEWIDVVFDDQAFERLHRESGLQAVRSPDDLAGLLATSH